MPLWRPYLRYLTSNIADLANSGPSTHGRQHHRGAVPGALRATKQPWAHLDVYAWNDSDRPGKPAGGEAQGLRAAYAMLKTRYG